MLRFNSHSQNCWAFFFALFLSSSSIAILTFDARCFQSKWHSFALLSKVYFRNIFSFSAFECEFCDRKYAHKGDLTKHLQIHVGNNIYTCEQCGMGFRLHLELRNHTYEHYKQDKQKSGEPNEATTSNLIWKITLKPWFVDIKIYQFKYNF